MTFDQVKAAHAANRPLTYKKDKDSEEVEVTVSTAASATQIFCQTETDGQGSAPFRVDADQLS